LSCANSIVAAKTRNSIGSESFLADRMIVSSSFLVATLELRREAQD
jgi:hypothetical protein